MSILENVKRGLSQPAVATPQLGAQEQAQALARATSGKATGGGTTPALSEQQQAQAQQQTMAQQRQLVQQGQQAAAQVSAAEQQIEAEARVQKRRLNEREIGLREQAAQKVDEVLTNYSQKLGQLDLAKDKAQAEQLGFMMRLSSEKYIEKLKIEGAKARLHDRISFTESLQRTMFAEERKLLDENLRFKSLIGATERDFREQAANIDLDTALAVAAAEAKGNNAAMKAQAIGGIITSGASMGSAAYNYANRPQTAAPLGDRAPSLTAMNPEPAPYNPQEDQNNLMRSWGLDV